MSSHSIPSSDVKPARSAYRIASDALSRNLDVGDYSRRSWTRRLPTVLTASLLSIPLLALPAIMVLWSNG